MSPIEIKIILLRLGLTISALAEEFGCYRQELSMMINGKRFYPHLQEKFAKKLGYTRAQLFGDRTRKAA